MEPSAVILAAGKSTRMKSNLSKVLHPVAGKPMISYVIAAARNAGCSRIILVVGHQSSAVKAALGASIEYAEQKEQLGTGHALLQTMPILQNELGPLLVMAGDAPLIRTETLQRMLESHLLSGAVVTVLTGRVTDPVGFGRIERGADGTVLRIIEEKDASELERAITEINSGVYCFSAGWLWSHLEKVGKSNSGEIYLTDIVGMATSEGSLVAGVTTEASEIVGINDRVQLANAEQIMRRRVTDQLMLEGTTIISPPLTFIDAGVEIGKDTIIYPNTFLQGASKIGERCVIGPNSIVRDCEIGNNCRILSSVIEESVLEDDIDVGPFSHIRAGSSIGDRVHIGNFAEVKKSRLGPDTKMGHFSYMGDATVGTNVNIAAGTVTCNFDGEEKHQTIIGDNAFIGSDTMLVAPVELGHGSVTGAGSVVTRDVPPDTTVYGVPAIVKSRKQKTKTSTD